MEWEGTIGLTQEQYDAIRLQHPGGNGCTPEKARAFGLEDVAKAIEDEVSGDVEVSGVGEDEEKPDPRVRRGRKKKR